MKNEKVKRILAALLCTAVVSTSLPLTAAATTAHGAEVTTTPEEESPLLESEATDPTSEEISVQLNLDEDLFDELLPDNDTLLEYYLQNALLRSDETTASASAQAVITPSYEITLADEQDVFLSGFSLSGTAMLASTGSDYLSGEQLAIYNELKTAFEEIAAGKRASTIVTLKTPFTVTPDELSTAGATIAQKLRTVILYLGADCPYDLYWYNKTSGASTSTQSSYNDDGNIEVYLTLSFYVVDDYVGSEQFTVNTEKLQSVSTAIENAKQIVKENAWKSDYDKLLAYKEKICELVSYNTAASKNYAGGYGDPWQLIYVFDNNSSTNVVCEGYSKAFQYLCDLSTFESDDTACYTVYGTMNGNHMWNIVHLDGQNYLVDLTNSEPGTAGQSGELFLAGATGSASTSYTITCNISSSGTYDAVYTYDSELLGFSDAYKNNVLTLTSTKYTPKDAASCSAPTANDLTYSGQAQDLVTAPNSVTGGTVVYSTEQYGTYSETIPQGTAVGNYTVWYMVKADGDHQNTAPQSVTVSIGQKQIDIDNVTVTPATLTYSGSEQNLLTNVPTTVEGGTLVYSSTKDGTYSETIPTGTNAGSYTVWYKGKATDSNYSDSEAKSVTATIEKQSLDISSVTLKGANTTYTGSAQDLVTNVSATAESGTLVYSLDENGTYTSTIPTKENAGSYTVYYKLQGDSNYSDSTVKHVTAQIKAKTIEAVALQPIDIDFDGQSHELLSTPQAVEGGTILYSLTKDGEYTDTIPTGTDAQDYTVWYKIQPNNENYTSSTEADHVVSTIRRKSIDAISLNAASLVWNGEEQALIQDPPSVTGGTLLYSTTGKDGEYSETIPTGKAVGDHTIWYKVQADSNHVDTEPQSITVTIQSQPIEGDVTVSPINTIYDGTAHELVSVTGTVTGGTLVYSSTKDGTYSETIPTGTNAGSYTVWYKIKSLDSTSETEPQHVVVTIEQQQAENVDLQVLELFYNGTEQQLVCEPAAPKIGTVVYSLSEDGPYSETIPTGTDAKDYKIYYKVQADAADSEQSNYRDSEIKHITATIHVKSLQGAAITLNSTGLTYNKTEQTQGIASVTLDGVNLTAGKDYTITDNTGTNAGSYTLTITGAGNYTDTATKEWSIEKATVTITAKDNSAKINTTMPELTYAISGLMDGDSLITTPTLTCDAKMDTAGSYTITCAGATADENYKIAYQNGTLKVYDSSSTGGETLSGGAGGSGNSGSSSNGSSGNSGDPGASSNETSSTEANTSGNTTIEKNSDGTTTETTKTVDNEKKTTVVTKVLDENNHVLTETVTEINHVSEQTTEVVTEMEEDGSVVKKTTTNSSTNADDLSKVITEETAYKNTTGNTVEETKTTTINSAGKTTSIVEEKTIRNVGSGTNATVTITKNGSGNVQEATAEIDKTGASKNNGLQATFTKKVVSQLKDAAGDAADDLTITMVVKDKSSNAHHSITVKLSDLTANNILYIYKQDANDNYVMVNAKAYTTDAKGQFKTTIKSKSDFVLLNQKDAKAANKSILSTVKAAKTKVTLSKSKSTTMKLAATLNTANVKSITYKSSKTSVATVNKNGKITAKKAGKTTVSAVVTLKNGSKKTVKMAVTVK